MQRLFLTALLVRDYSEAIAFYTEKLGFEVRLDEPAHVEPYGTVAVFGDLYSNRRDLIEHSGYSGRRSASSAT